MEFIGLAILIMASLDTIATIYLFLKDRKLVSEIIEKDLLWLIQQKAFKTVCWNLLANLLIIIYFCGEIF